MQATDRSLTLETHLNSVKVEKRSVTQGMWDVAMTELPELSQSSEKKDFCASLNPRYLGEICQSGSMFYVVFALICPSFADTPSLTGLPNDDTDCPAP